MDTGHHAMAPTGVDDPRERFVESWIGLVLRRRETERERQVGGTDVHGVDAGHGEDLVDALHGGEEQEPLPYRGAVVGFLACLGALIYLCWAAGMSPALALLLFIAVLIGDRLFS